LLPRRRGYRLRRIRDLFVADLEDWSSLRELEAAFDQVGNDDSSRHLGSQHGQRDQVLLALD